MKLLYYDDQYKLDKYILTKYSLLENEKFLEEFPGNIRDSQKILTARIFLTNYRIIASGYYVEKSSGTSINPGLIRTVIQLKKMKRQRAITHAIQKSLNIELASKNIIPYGYVYPIFNAYNIKRKKKYLSYNVNIEYEDKGKSKSMKLSVIIFPFRAKKNPEYHQKILDKIEELVLKHQ